MDRSIAALLVDASERFLGDALGRVDSAGYGGLSVSHAFAVQLIGSGVATITALSGAMRMTPQAVSALVNQLAERGFMVKGRKAHDARARILTLTGEGGRLAAEIAGALRDIEQEWSDLVGAERLADVSAALGAYVSDGQDANPAPARKRLRRVRIV